MNYKELIEIKKYGSNSREKNIDLSLSTNIRKDKDKMNGSLDNFISLYKYIRNTLQSEEKKGNQELIDEFSELYNLLSKENIVLFMQIQKLYKDLIKT